MSITETPHSGHRAHDDPGSEGCCRGRSRWCLRREVQVHADPDEVRVAADQGAVGAVERPPATADLVLARDGRERVAGADDVDALADLLRGVVRRRVVQSLAVRAAGRARGRVCLRAVSGAAVARADGPGTPALAVQDPLGDGDLLAA